MDRTIVLPDPEGGEQRRRSLSVCSREAAALARVDANAGTDVLRRRALRGPGRSRSLQRRAMSGALVDKYGAAGMIGRLSGLKGLQHRR